MRRLDTLKLLYKCKCNIQSQSIPSEVPFKTAEDRTYLTMTFCLGIAPHGGKELEIMNFTKLKRYSLKKNIMLGRLSIINTQRK